MRKKKREKVNYLSYFERFIKEATSLFDNITKKNDNSLSDHLDNEFDYPSLTEVLPYQYFDDARNIFINKNSIGFILECDLLIGANPNIVGSLDEMFRNKIRSKTPIQLTFVASKEIKHILDYGLRNEKWRGENADYFNAVSSAFYQKACINRFDNGHDFKLTLRNYKLYITYAVDKKRNTKEQLNQIKGDMDIMRSSLSGASIQSQPCDASKLLSLVREMINVDMDSHEHSSNEYNPLFTIDEQCLDKKTQLTVCKDHIEVISEKKGNEVGSTSTYISQLMIANNPKDAYLWSVADNIGSLLTPSIMIGSPFIINFIIEVEDSAKVQSEINTKFLNKDKSAKSQMAHFVPSIKAEAQELDDLRKKFESNKSTLCLYHYNITIFSRNEDEARYNEQDVLNTYRSNGINLTPPEFMQIANFLAMFPFVPNDHLWGDLKKIGAVNRCEPYQAINLMPLVSDDRLAQEGLLAPTFRNQVSFINLFDMGTDNYNCAITGTAGAGKSVISQSLLYEVLNNGGKEWIIDLGDSYKNYCNIVGGSYISASSLRFNCFANIADPNPEYSDEDNKKRRLDSLAQIGRLIMVMADPQGKFTDNIVETIITNAVTHAYKTKKNKARIDDVVDYIKNERKQEEYNDQPTIRVRMSELAFLLEKYTTRGEYGDYFNSDEPTLTNEHNLVVLELGELQHLPDLLAVVLYNLIMSIEEYMYSSPRSMKKVCAIDEAWRLLSSSDRVAKFIEVGYRTARKHRGSFITITQGIIDFTKSTAAEAAWNNSAIKIIGKQDIQGFKNYITQYPDNLEPHIVEVIQTFGNASSNRFSSFILMKNNTKQPCRLFLDPLRRTLFSSTGEDFDRISELLKDNKRSVSDAIYIRAKEKFSVEMNELEQLVTRSTGLTYQNVNNIH